MARTVLWWGNFDAEYSRNRILWNAFGRLGWRVSAYQPANPGFSYWLARLRGVQKPDLVFVPCFCQKDILSAVSFGRHCDVPVIIDPLISLYDTRVFERKTVGDGSAEARRLLKFEARAFGAADMVIADTEAHGRYFCDIFGVSPERIQVIPVSAEEPLFDVAADAQPPHNPVEVLFYGSFIPLHGVEVIIDAIRGYRGPAVRWCLLGGVNSKIRIQAKRILAGNESVIFEDNVPYERLPQRIHHADILLGVFGNSSKTVRVIPNKVCQSLACGRPVISCEGPYPIAMRQSGESGMIWVPPADPAALAAAVAGLAGDADRLLEMRRQARLSYETYFDNNRVCSSLMQALQKIKLAR
jgi:glycosyltransferase involved in cell wall biosynthesis